MEAAKFRRELAKVETLGKLEADPVRAAYYRGRGRGLRRRYHGENFGTEAEHDLFMAAAESGLDAERRALGKGYRDGLNLTGEEHDR
jgi:hypothetical protein